MWVSTSGSPGTMSCPERNGTCSWRSSFSAVISRKRVSENSTCLRSVPASETVVKRTFVRLSKIFTRSVMCATLPSALLGRERRFRRLVQVVERLTFSVLVLLKRRLHRAPWVEDRSHGSVTAGSGDGMAARSPHSARPTTAAPSSGHRCAPPEAHNGADPPIAGRQRVVAVILRRLHRPQQPHSRRVGGTSTTYSPAARSCWDNNFPRPSADSIAHVRSSPSGAAHANSPESRRLGPHGERRPRSFIPSVMGCSVERSESIAIGSALDLRGSR